MIAGIRSITYDIPSIIALQEDYLKTIEFIKDELPDVNWNSTLETKEFFKDILHIGLRDTKISTLNWLISDESGDITEDDRNFISGLIELKKLQGVVGNYTSQILKHVDKDGVYQLRCVDGKWLQQNKREVSYLKEIQNCIISVQ